MRLLKLSTVVTLRIGPALDSTGAEFTTLVIGELTLTKNGTSAAMAAAATLTHVANGHYSLVTIAGNTDTLGSLRIDCNRATVQIPPVEGTVVPAMIYDSLVLGTDRFDTNVTHVSDTAQTATDHGAQLTTITGRLPTALVSGRMDADLGAISGSTAPVANFKRGLMGTLVGTVGTGSTTTSIVLSALTPIGVDADSLKGKILTFPEDTTTTGLRGQSTNITANTGVAAPTLTVASLTRAPVSGDIVLIS